MNNMHTLFENVRPKQVIAGATLLGGAVILLKKFGAIDLDDRITVVIALLTLAGIFANRAEQVNHRQYGLM
jgi:hypothetical protein